MDDGVTQGPLIDEAAVRKVEALVKDALDKGQPFAFETVMSTPGKLALLQEAKGKGFQGTIKRHNFTMGDATHGNSLSHRSPGSIGQRQTPGRVFPGKKMSGHMGAEVQSAQNLEVVRVDVERGLLLIKGGVPGHDGGDVIVRPAVKAGN